MGWQCHHVIQHDRPPDQQVREKYTRAEALESLVLFRLDDEHPGALLNTARCAAGKFLAGLRGDKWKSIFALDDLPS
jgi:hypothetical protein